MINSRNVKMSIGNRAEVVPLVKDIRAQAMVNNNVMPIRGFQRGGMVLPGMSKLPTIMPVRPKLPMILLNRIKANATV